MYEVAEISPREYRSLAEFRYRLRRFLHFSEAAAKLAGIEPRQHQLLLAVKAKEPEHAGIGYLAERLQLRHHSVVELVDRLERSGLARRQRRDKDRRSADVSLTEKGAKILRDLSLPHRTELRSALPALIESLQEIQDAGANRNAAARDGNHWNAQRNVVRGEAKPAAQPSVVRD